MHKNCDELDALNDIFTSPMVSALFFSVASGELVFFFPPVLATSAKIRDTSYYCTGSTIYSY